MRRAQSPAQVQKFVMTERLARRNERRYEFYGSNCTFFAAIAGHEPLTENGRYLLWEQRAGVPGDLLTDDLGGHLYQLRGMSDRFKLNI